MQEISYSSCGVDDVVRAVEQLGLEPEPVYYDNVLIKGNKAVGVTISVYGKHWIYYGILRSVYQYDPLKNTHYQITKLIGSMYRYISFVLEDHPRSHGWLIDRLNLTEDRLHEASWSNRLALEFGMYRLETMLWEERRRDVSWPLDPNNVAS